MSVGPSVRPSVRRSVGPSVGRSVRHTRVEFSRNGPNSNKIASGIRKNAILKTIQRQVRGQLARTHLLSELCSTCYGGNHSFTCALSRAKCHQTCTSRLRWSLPKKDETTCLDFYLPRFNILMRLTPRFPYLTF